MQSVSRATKADKADAARGPGLWKKSGVEKLRFGDAPLLAAAVWFALGEVLAHHRALAVVLTLALVALYMLAFAALRWSLRFAVLPVAAVWMAVGMWCAEVQPAPAP